MGGRSRGAVRSLASRSMARPEKRRGPPGVVKLSIRPPPAQRRNVSGSTPSRLLAAPTDSQSDGDPIAGTAVGTGIERLLRAGSWGQRPENLGKSRYDAG